MCLFYTKKRRFLFACAVLVESLPKHVLRFSCFGTGPLWSGCRRLALRASLCKGQCAELSCGRCWAGALAASLIPFPASVAHS